ncbi:zinc finger, CCHC-type containing protein [Tanacetum coccineum]
MSSMNIRLNIKKLDENIVQNHGGLKQVGFKQLGPCVETGVHGVHDEKRVWFEVELQGAQRDRRSEVFQVSNDDTTVAQRRLKDKQPEDKTNTDCLVKKQEKEYQTGWKIKTGIQQQNGLVDETNMTLFAKVRCFLIQSGLSKVFWVEDTTRSTYLVNRSPSSAIGFKKPIDMLKVFCWLASIKQGMLEPIKVKNTGFNKSEEYKKTFIGSGVGTGSMQVLRGFEFEVEPLGDHTFELARDREQHLACELFGYREDSNEAAFAVAIVEKIYAHESLTFNNTVDCEVIFKWNDGLTDDIDARSDVYVLSNGCRKCIHDLQREVVQTLLEGHFILSLEGSLSRDCDAEKNDVGMLDKFDRGLQTDVQVFVDFDYAMGRSITVMSRSITGYGLMILRCAGSLKANLQYMESLLTTKAGYMTFTEAWKKEIWLKGLLTESGYKLKLVAVLSIVPHHQGNHRDYFSNDTFRGRSLVSSDVYYEVTPPDTFPLRHIFGGVTIGALVKACYRSEVSAQVKVDAYRSNLFRTSNQVIGCRILQVTSLQGWIKWLSPLPLETQRSSVRSSLFARNCPKILGEYIANAPLTPLVKPGGDDLQFGVGMSGGGEAILYPMNHLIEVRRDDVELSMLLVYFKNAFNLVDREVMLEKVRLHCPVISRWVEFCYSSPARLYYGEHTLWSCQEVQHGDLLGPLLFYLVLHPLICKISDSFSLSLQAWYLDDGTFIGDTLVVGKVLELIMEDGPRCGLHLNVNKTEVFWPKEDPRSRLVGVFPPNIAWLLHGVKLLGGPASVDFNFSSELVMKRVAKTIVCLRWPKRFFDAALRSALECIVTAYGPGFGDWQWRLATLPFAFGGLGVYCVAFGPAFNDALCAFNTKMETDLLSNASEIAAPKLMKKLADIYFTRVTQTVESTFSLSSRQMALWQSQMEDHTLD